jgi:hypothetical protein
MTMPTLLMQRAHDEVMAEDGATLPECRGRAGRAEAEAVIDACFAELKVLVGTAGACRGSGKSRSTHYRRCQPPKLGPCRPRSTPANALSEVETGEPRRPRATALELRSSATKATTCLPRVSRR